MRDKIDVGLAIKPSPGGRGRGNRAVGVASGLWVWLEDSGRGFRAVGVASGLSVWLDDSGLGVRTDRVYSLWDQADGSRTGSIACGTRLMGPGQGLQPVGPGRWVQDRSVMWFAK
ncbi:unnamed protein product [Boreogadus saida]